MSASPSDMPSQLEAPHPEFGYLAPTTRFRRRIALTLKAAVLGGLAGAAAMYFLTIDREEQKALTMLATPVLIAPEASKPAQAAIPTRMAALYNAAPVLFVPASIALPAATKPAQAVVPAQMAALYNAAPVLFVPASIALPAATKPAQAVVPTQMAALYNAPPVLFIPESIALPAASKPAQAAMPTRMAALDNVAPVLFLPETIALPAVAPREPQLRGSIPTMVAATAPEPIPQAPSTVDASPAASAFAAEPAPAPAAKAAAKPKRKIVREPHRERTARFVPPEPEPPPRRFGLPIFGFGW